MNEWILKVLCDSQLSIPKNQMCNCIFYSSWAFSLFQHIMLIVAIILSLSCSSLTQYSNLINWSGIEISSMYPVFIGHNNYIMDHKLLKCWLTEFKTINSGFSINNILTKCISFWITGEISWQGRYIYCVVPNMASMITKQRFGGRSS